MDNNEIKTDDKKAFLRIECFEDYSIVTMINNSGKVVTIPMSINSVKNAFFTNDSAIASPILPVNTIRIKDCGSTLLLYTYNKGTNMNMRTEIWEEDDDGDEREITTEYENVIIPNLITKYSLYYDKNLKEYTLGETFCWAVKDDPLLFNENTQLYNLPYPNIDSGACICWGDNMSPTSKSLTLYSNYIFKFFNTPFNTDLFYYSNNTISCLHDFFRALENKTEFPSDFYVSTNKRLGEI